MDTQKKKGGNQVPARQEVPAEDEIVRQRKDKLERLRTEEGYDPYLVEKWNRTHPLSWVKKNFTHHS